MSLENLINFRVPTELKHQAITTTNMQDSLEVLAYVSFWTCMNQRRNFLGTDCLCAQLPLFQRLTERGDRSSFYTDISKAGCLYRELGYQKLLKVLDGLSIFQNLLESKT